MTNEVVGRVCHDLARYEHLTFDSEAQPARDAIEIRIRYKVPGREISHHSFCLEPREIEDSQFAGTFQKQLCGCLHHYVIEMFVRNPERQN